MTKVKICGLKRIEDIDAVNRSMPDYIGFVFAESRRRVDAETAAELKRNLDGRIKAVGVFADQDAAYIAGLYREGIIDIAQLHGNEDGEYIARLRGICGCPVIKAMRVKDVLPAPPEGADYILFDSGGGSGMTFNWEILSGFAGLPYFLAGGLDETNVMRAIKLLDPYCVDVSSGVESGGNKDPEKIKNFVETVRFRHKTP